MWGIGCVFFEIVSLYPLFPGTNELDQINKIHNIIGTPSPALLAKMKQRSTHMEFNFPPREGSGIAPLIPHASPECTDLICSLLQYDPDARLSARQALRHPYFRELREQDKRQQALLAAAAADAAGSTPPGDSRTPAQPSRPSPARAQGIGMPGASLQAEASSSSMRHSAGARRASGGGAAADAAAAKGSPSLTRCVVVT
jgi:renal tumor antigen